MNQLGFVTEYRILFNIIVEVFYHVQLYKLHNVLMPVIMMGICRYDLKIGRNILQNYHQLQYN